MRKKIRYVSLESDAFITDTSFQLMTCEERGAYFSIIVYLYVSGGYMPMDKAALAGLCNCTNFENVFEKIKHKFLIKDGKISHKRVLAELKRARQISQLQRKYGLMGAKSRWENDGKGNGKGTTKRSEGEAKGSEDKRREGKSEAKKEEEKKRDMASHFVSPSVSSDDSSQRLGSPPAAVLRQQDAGGTIPVDFTMKLIYLNDGLCKIFTQRTPADTSSIRNVSTWVINRIKLGLFQDKIIGNVLAIARDSKKGKSRKPIAVFYAQLKTDLGYKQNE